ncbi:outer membrane protein assembly factor BamB family protein [Cellulomonas palmilytica]|uniref:outer membrane protein assembly factor BamB family protein n=1 Tax=Cellulomonas palmilytica TaxID=2608402 RepID=UPI001F1B035C|nr:PQQ-binding-like beta-propeller repeat protein [Cellulomonas palmilytica]
MQRVELDEGEDRVPDRRPAMPADEPDALPLRRRRSRRGAALVGAGAALVVGGLAVGQAVLDARERRTVAALQDVDGVLPPVGDRLTVAYSIDSPSAFDVVGDRLMTAADDPDGTRRVTVRSAEDGRELWSAPVGTAPDSSEHAVVAQAPCRAATTDAWGDVVLCLDTDATTWWGDTGELERDEATYVRLVVLGLADGTEVVRRELDADVRDALLIDDVLVTVRASGRQAVLTGSDLDGTVRWERRLDDDETGGGSGPITLTETGGAVWVDGSAGLPLGLVTSDGEVLPHEVDGSWASDDDTLLLVEATGAGSRTTLIRDAEAAATVEGNPVQTVVDDESLGDVVLTDQDGLTLWDVRTGDARWTVPEEADLSGGYTRSLYGSIVLRGVVYVWDESAVRAFAGSDGRLLWTDEPEGFGVSEVLTDGTRLYVSPSFEEGSDGVSSLRALTLEGDPAGRVALPDDLRWTMSFDGWFWGVRERGEDYGVVALR